MRCRFDFHNPDKTVILAGCGRSGTTWLGDLMNYRNRFRVLFEPFFPKEVPDLGPGWTPLQYIRPTDDTAPGIPAVRRILAGRITNPWVDQFNTRRFATRRLIKDIRANNILGWIRAHYPTIPIVYILRHPVPTALSQLKLGWPTEFRRFLDQPHLMEDFLEPYRDEMTRGRDPFEARLAIWCIMNLVPLRQFAAGGLHVVFYEDLCRRPEQVLPPLFAHIGEQYRPWILETLNKPSKLSRGQSAIVKGADTVDSWRGQATPAQMKAAETVLARFGMDRLYGSESLPRVAASEVPGLFRK